MTHNGLTFFDLYSIYRLQRIGIRQALHYAWQYRNFVPDHSQSRAMMAELQEQRARAYSEAMNKLNESSDNSAAMQYLADHPNTGFQR